MSVVIRLREEAMKKENRTGSFHMSLSERMVIEHGLRVGKTFREIAWEIARDPTTVSKEVKRVIWANGNPKDLADCLYASSCRRTDLCMGMNCTSFCKACDAVNCAEVCGRRKPARCEKLLRPPYVCNGCERTKIVISARYTTGRKMLSGFVSFY